MYQHISTMAEGGEAVPPALPPLGATVETPLIVDPILSIWEDNYAVPNLDDSWLCLRCNTRFTPKHATRATAHFAKVKNLGIKICPAIIPTPEATCYKELYHLILSKANAEKCGAAALLTSASERQEEATVSMLQKKLKTPVPMFAAAAFSPSDSAVSSCVKSASSSPRRYLQSSLNGLVDKMKQSDIRTTINCHLKMSIADLCHSKNLSDRIVESPRFQLVLQNASMADSSFKIPGRKKIGGELLDLNYMKCVDKNKEDLLKEAPIFGLSWLSDGATIARMPLINILGMCADIPPTCVAIHDCSEHIAGGGKKDAPFIAGLMKGIVEQYDPDAYFTDLFFFDGASNVAKAGKVLEQYYPRAYALHGGKHVVSLFFDDMSKLPAVQVGYFLCVL